METRTPHETDLHSNDFVRFWHETAKPFWDRWGNIISVVLVIVCGGYAIYQYRVYSHMDSSEKAWTAVANASSPDSYYMVAADHRTSRPAVAASAWLAGADLSLAEARKALASPAIVTTNTGDVLNKPVTAEDHLSKAFAGYDNAAKLINVDPAFALNAKLGMAAVSEARLEWDQAATLYEAVVTDAGESYPMLKARAASRLQLLPRLKKPVAFIDAPPMEFNMDELGNWGATPGSTGGLELPGFDAVMEEGRATDDLLPVEPSEMDDTQPSTDAPTEDAATDAATDDVTPPSE